MEISMAPGLGLYLDELFFDRYHIKIEFENEKIRKMIEKQKKSLNDDAQADQSNAVSTELYQLCCSIPNNNPSM